MPMRVDRKEEEMGLDKGEHGEEADYTVDISNDMATYQSDMNMYAKEFRGQMADLNSPKTPGPRDH